MLSGTSISLGSFSSLATKNQLKQLITQHGGDVTYMVTPKTTHVITTTEEVGLSSSKLRKAIDLGVHIVSQEWLDQSIQRGRQLDAWSFSLLPELEPLRHRFPPERHVDADIGVDVDIPVVRNGNCAGDDAKGPILGPEAHVMRTLRHAVLSIHMLVPATSSYWEEQAKWKRKNELKRVPKKITNFKVTAADTVSFLESSIELAPELPAKYNIELPPDPPKNGYHNDPITNTATNSNNNNGTDDMADEKVEVDWFEEMSKKLQKQREEREAELNEKKREDELRRRLKGLEIEKEKLQELMKWAASDEEIKKFRAQQRKEQKLQKLREGWLREIERKKQREEAKEAERQRKKKEWEDFIAEKKRKKEEWERKKREWEASKAEREQRSREWEAKKKLWDQIKEQEKHKKIFVGNVKFDDLTIEELGSETSVEFTKTKRRELMKSIFSTFGTVARIKEHWDKGFVFVVYREIADAEKAFDTLTTFEERTRIADAMKKKLLDEGQSSIYAPLPRYYVRWPKKDPHPDSDEEESEPEVDQKAVDAAEGWEGVTVKKSKKAQAIEATLKAEKEKSDADKKQREKDEKREARRKAKAKEAKEKRKGKKGRAREEEKAKRKAERAALRLAAQASGGGNVAKRTGKGKPKPKSKKPTNTDGYKEGPLTTDRPARGRGMRGARGMRGGSRGRGGPRPALPVGPDGASASASAFGAPSPGGRGRGGPMRGMRGGRGGFGMRGRGGRGGSGGRGGPATPTAQ